MNLLTVVAVLLFVSSLKRKKNVRKGGCPLFMTSVKIDEFEHIKISPIVKEDGSPWIWNSKTGRWLHASMTPSGYWRVNVHMGKKKAKKILLSSIACSHIYSKSRSRASQNCRS
jgi:hypothetical protein